MDNEQNQEYRDDVPYPGSLPPAASRKHSGLGIASFVLALVSIALFAVVIIVSSIAVGSIAKEMMSAGEALTPEQVLNRAPLLVVAGLVFMAVALASLIGGVLGIVGLFQRDRKKIFAILGTVLNLLGWAIFIVMIGLSLALQRGGM